MKKLKTNANQIIMVTRYGGYGDLTMMLHTFRALRDMYGGWKIVLRTYGDYREYAEFIFNGLIDQVVLDSNRYDLFPKESGFFTLDKDTTFGPKEATVLHFNLQGAIERSKEHGVLAFSQAAFVPTSMTKAEALEDNICENHPLLRSDESPYILIQLRNNEDGRGLTREMLPDWEKLNLNIKVKVLGPEPKDLPSLDTFLHLVYNAQYIIGSDSFGLHLAHALYSDAICYGLYSPDFPPSTRAYEGMWSMTDPVQFKKAIQDLFDKFTEGEKMFSNCPTCGTLTKDKHPNSPYWKCNGCEVWYQDPMPPKLFEAAEEKGEDGRSNGHNQPESDLKQSAHLARCYAQNWIAKVPPLDGRPFKKAMDIGCKFPYFAHILKTEFQIDAYGIDGMDFDKANDTPILSQYQQALGIPMLMVDFERVTTEQILANTSDDKPFDALSMVHVFEHMYDPKGALKKLRELLRDEGVLLIRVPSHEVAGRDWHLTDRHYGIHPFFYSEKAMRYVVEQEGSFEIVETYPMPAGTRDYILKPKR
jgi:2-polyprenyl-3-methyl-5-hydroxy-6-metoxy-1,4-benzoquinol methylase